MTISFDIANNDENKDHDDHDDDNEDEDEDDDDNNDKNQKLLLSKLSKLEEELGFNCYFYLPPSPVRNFRLRVRFLLVLPIAALGFFAFDAIVEIFLLPLIINRNSNCNAESNISTLTPGSRRHVSKCPVPNNSF